MALSRSRASIITLARASPVAAAAMPDAIEGAAAPMDDDDDDEPPTFVPLDDEADPAEAWEDPSVGGVLTSILNACEMGDADALASLLPSLSDSHLETKGPDGDTALHLACLYGHAACARLLLSRGASPSARDGDDGTPLHDASAGGFDDVVALLIDAAARAGSGGVDGVVRAVDGDGETALHCAARGGHLDVARALLAAGARKDAASALGDLAWQCAEEGSDVQALCK